MSLSNYMRNKSTKKSLSQKAKEKESDKIVFYQSIPKADRGEFKTESISKALPNVPTPVLPQKARETATASKKTTNALIDRKTQAQADLNKISFGEQRDIEKAQGVKKTIADTLTNQGVKKESTSMPSLTIDLRTKAQKEREAEATKGLTEVQKVALGIKKGTREEREQANIEAAKTPQGAFASNFFEGASFGLSNLAFTDAEKEAQKIGEQENKGAAITGQIAGSLIPQGILYKAVNKALAGTKIGSTALQGGLKGFGASQGAQLVADAIVQTPVEIIRAIEDDKDIDEFGKDWLVNRGIDALMNTAMGGIEIGLPKLKQVLTSDRAKKVIADKGIPVDDLVKAVDEGDTEKVVFYVNQYGVADAKPFEQLQLEAPVRTNSDTIASRLSTNVNAVKSDSSGIDLYHGTWRKHKGFEAGRDFYFTPDKEFAESFIRQPREGTDLGGELLQGKLNKNAKILDTRTVEGKKIADEIINNDYYMSYSGLDKYKESKFENGLPKFTADDFIAEAKAKGYDGIVLAESLGKEGTTSFRLFNPDAIVVKPQIERPSEFSIGSKYPRLAKDFSTERPFTVTQGEAPNLFTQPTTLSTKDELKNKFQEIAGRTSIANPNASIPTPKTVRTLDDVIVRAPELKDVRPSKRYNTDVYRNFETVFGKNTPEFKVVKSQVLDQFDNAKGQMVDDVRKYTDELMEVVNKYGIEKRSKESKLLMRYGENRIDYDGLVKEVGQAKANNIVEAETWFRKTYDDLLDQVNASREAMGKEAIPKRSDYFRHYNEIANIFESLKNILEGSAKIDPKLMGLSEFTKPREAWASFKQRRTDGTKFTEDAVGGMLDYIKASTYAKHIDPQISNFRTFRSELANATEGTKNINNFIEYLDDFTNDLSGKTNPFDRTLQKALGRTGMSVLNTLNSRVKANAVLGNLSSSLAQIANVPQAIARIKDPVALSKGFLDLVTSIGKNDSIYNQSNFLKERYIQDAYSKFDRRIIDQPKKVAAWLLGALDEVGTKFTWSSAYEKAIKEGIKNPAKYADDLTRKMVAGRGIGEVPLLQKSSTFQLIAPFTTEVNNMWKVMQDMVSEKDLAGLGIFFALNYGLNRGMEQVRGSGVTFDPIDALISGYDSEDTFSDNLIGVGGSLAGEVLSNLPLGGAIGSAYPEYGAKVGELELPTRAELFGEADPTRFGVSIPLVKAAQDPLKNFALPWGGAQVSKTIAGAQTMGLLPQNVLTGKDEITKETFPASVTKSGKIRTFVEPTPLKTAQALAFGGYASPEVRTYFKNEMREFGENQTPNMIQLVREGFDPQKLQTALTEGRKVSKKEERKKVLEDAGFNKQEVNRIMEVFYGYKAGD